MSRIRFALLAAACTPLLIATAAAAQTAIPGVDAIRYTFNTDTGAITYTVTQGGFTTPPLDFSNFGNRLNGVQVVARGVDSTSTRFRWSIQGNFILQAGETISFVGSRAGSVHVGNKSFINGRITADAAGTTPGNGGTAGTAGSAGRSGGIPNLVGETYTTGAFGSRGGNGPDPGPGGQILRGFVRSSPQMIGQGNSEQLFFFDGIAGGRPGTRGQAAVGGGTPGSDGQRGQDGNRALDGTAGAAGAAGSAGTGRFTGIGASAALRGGTGGGGGQGGGGGNAGFAGTGASGGGGGGQGGDTLVGDRAIERGNAGGDGSRGGNGGRGGFGGTGGAGGTGGGGGGAFEIISRGQVIMSNARLSATGGAGAAGAGGFFGTLGESGTTGFAGQPGATDRFSARGGSGGGGGDGGRGGNGGRGGDGGQGGTGGGGTILINSGTQIGGSVQVDTSGGQNGGVQFGRGDTAGFLTNRLGVDAINANVSLSNTDLGVTRLSALNFAPSFPARQLVPLFDDLQGGAGSFGLSDSPQLNSFVNSFLLAQAAPDAIMGGALFRDTSGAGRNVIALSALRGDVLNPAFSVAQGLISFSLPPIGLYQYGWADDPMFGGSGQERQLTRLCDQCVYLLMMPSSFDLNLNQLTFDLHGNGLFTRTYWTGTNDLFFLGPAAPPPTIPEPASWAMLISGMGLVGAVARRRRTGRAVAS